MTAIRKIDTGIYYILLLFALCSSLSIAGTSITMYLALLLAIIRYIKEPFKLNLDTGLLKAVSIFIIAISISSLFSYDMLASFKRVSSIITQIIPLLLAVAFIKDKSKLIAMLIMLSVSMFIANGYAVWQGVGGDFRAMSFTSYPMVLAGYLVQMIPLMLVFCFKDAGLSRKFRIVMFSSTLLSLLALAFNGTRGAWIAVVIIILLYSLLRIRKNTKQIVGLLLSILVISIMAANVPQIQERLGTMVDTKYQSNTERVLLWQSAWHMFVDQPVDGIGLGQFSNLYKKQYISPLAKEPDLPHAHNNVMQFLAETGLIGTIAFIYMFGFIIYQNYKRYVSHSNMWTLAFTLTTIGFLVQGLTEYNFGHVSVMRMYWVIAGLTYAGWNLEKTTKH